MTPYAYHWELNADVGRSLPDAHVTRRAFRGRSEIAVLGPHDAAGSVAADWLLLRGARVEARVRLRGVEHWGRYGYPGHRDYLWVTEPVLGALES